MSGGRVSIPNNVRKTIHNIKEITGNHSEDEIYAMLKECSMDPNETAQKLLLQDPFHEVKRKRDRKKEIPHKESIEPKWRTGIHGRGNRGGRGNFSSRHNSNETSGGRRSYSAMENGINKVAEDRTNPKMQHVHKNKETITLASSDRSSEIIAGSSSIIIVGNNKKQSEVTPSTGSGVGPHVSVSNKTPSASPGVYLSDSDPILMPSQDSRFPVGTIRREVGSQRNPVEPIQETPLEIKSTTSGSEVGSSSIKTPIELQGVGKNVVLETSRPGSSSHNSFTMSRPSSNYNNRLQQTIGQQKVGPSMEWKPKPTNPVLVEGTGSSDSVIKAPAVSVTTPSSSSVNLDSNDAAIDEVEKKLQESHISDDHHHQHVIIPTHLHVPEADKLGFCFGSFDASFGFNPTSSNDPVTDKSSEASEVVDENIEEENPRNENVLVTPDERDHADVSSNSATEYREPKQETSSPPTSSHQYPQAVHTSPNFSFGFMPPMIGSHLSSFENNESQPRDASHVPSFVVQQPFDPASYYAQFYRSGADSDGRLSPFHSTGIPTKYNGNVAVLSQQASQSSQEVGNSLMMSAAGPTPITTQSAGVMQNSIAVTQQPLPVFRQPTGVHLPHYPPNYIPYGPYFSPFYVPPPMHQFLSNGSFPQQHQGGNMYQPAPQVAAATPKYPLPQYKPGSNNTGNPTHIGMAGSYGPYGSNPANYNPGSATTAGNSTSNEDLGGSQFKENNVYITGQQSEGSGVWIAAPGRDMASSFYNLPQGGQVAYTPTQPSFANIYHHPPQPVTTAPVHPLLQQSQTLAAGGAGVDMVGPTASVYQQPQPNQINWPNNY